MSKILKRNLFELSMYVYVLIIFLYNCVNYITIGIGVAWAGILLVTEIIKFIRKFNNE